MSTPEMALAAYRQGYDDATAKLQIEVAKLREENTTMREQWHEEHEEMADYILELRQKLEAISPPSEAVQQQKEQNNE